MRKLISLTPFLSIAATLLLLALAPLYGQSLGLKEHFCAEGKQKQAAVGLLADGLTSPAHRALMQQYDTHWIKLDLKIERNSLQVAGNAIMEVKPQVNNFTVFAFELHPNFQIQSVTVDGQISPVERNGGEATILLVSPKQKGQKVRVQIFYAGTSPSDASAAIGNGLNTAVAQPWGNQITWSLSEPFAAYEWFPSKQILADKIDSVDIWITTDVSNKVGSNGLLQRVTPMPNGKHRYEWKSNYPIAYYLLSVAVGQYQEYNYNVTIPGLAKPVFVQNYIYEHPQSLAHYKLEMDRIPTFLQVFSRLFGLYPFAAEKYGHSLAPLAGGMEHQTMTTQYSFDYGLTAHELAHQWWGDEVTNASWSHIWLNEGFATYSELLAVENMIPEFRTQWLNSVHQSALTRPKGKVFVEDSTNVARIFNSSLTYHKAGFVLHMLRHALGSDDLFFSVLKAYRQEFRFKVATTRDFQRVVEKVSGRPFAYFFDQWIYGEGYPAFQVTWNQESNNLFLKSVQTTSSAATPFFKTEIEYNIKTTTKDTLVVVQHTAPNQHYEFKISGQVLSVQIDPNQWLLDNSPLAVYDPTLEAPVVEPLSIYPNPTLGVLNLRGGEQLPARVVIYDVLGRKVWSAVPLNPLLDVTGLLPGAYFLRTEYANKKEVLRFIKL